MLLNDQINKCTIYDKFLIDDLLDYTLIENGGALTIQYRGSDSSVVDFGVLEGVAASLVNSSFDNVKDKRDCWYPAIINLSNSNTYTKNLIKGFSVNFDNLGIEKALSFDAKLKNWNSSSTLEMSIDWIINSPILPFIPKYGILFWYKKKSNVNFVRFDDTPLEVPLLSEREYSYLTSDKQLITIRPGYAVRKINQDQIYIDEAPSENNIKIFSISTYISSIVKQATDETDEQYQQRVKNARDQIRFKKLSDNLSAFNTLLDTDIYISNGDTYSYTTNEEEMTNNYLNNMAIKSYVSITQYPYYKEIYDLLTIDQIKKINQGIDPVVSRRLKKLAHVLSTFPAIDRTTQSILLHPEIKTYIRDVFLKNPITSLPNEINALTTAIKFISPFFIQHSDGASCANLSGNYIGSKTDLFQKLISKYTPHLRISQDTALVYKDFLPNGPNIKINQDVSSKCSKALKGQVVFNNFSASIGPFNIDTSFSADNTSIICYHINNKKNATVIPLWDIKRKTLSSPKIEVSTGPDVKVPMAYTKIENDRFGYRYEMIETEYELNYSVYENQIMEGDRPKIEWSRLAGTDCIRFSDRNITKIPGDRYAVSTEDNPTLYIKKPGKYTLQLKVSTSFGIVYDNLIVYAYDAGPYKNDPRPLPGNTPIGPLRSARIKEIKPSEGLVVLCPNIREFAVGQNGVFKPSYTDCTIYTRDIDRAGRTYKLEYFDTCFPIRFTGLAQTTGGQLKLIYKPGNTTITLSRIILTNMMTKGSTQCESFFKNLIDNEGYVTDLNAISIVNPLNNETITLSNEDFRISTANTRIESYGGYPSGILNTLNIDIPFHPKNLKTPQPLTDLYGISLDGPRDGSGKLQHLCYLNNINHELNFRFEKGYFDPYLGWRKDNIYKNKTSVIKYNPGKRKALVFKGQGFSSLINEFLDNKPSYKVYKSRITLTCNDDIVGDCPPPGQREKEDVCPSGVIKEYDMKEIDDYYRNNGYRILDQYADPTQSKYSDEFGVSVSLNADGYVNISDQNYCTTEDDEGPLSNITYTLNQKGSYLPEGSRGTYRFGRELTGATIQDLEVQLNFLNYANPKDLIIWIDVIPSSSLGKTLLPPQGKPRDRFSIINFNKYVNSPFGDKYKEIYEQILRTINIPLRQYLLSLFMMNENPEDPLNPSNSQQEEYDPLKPKSLIYRLYLLNQENITNLTPNSSIKFSDHSHRFSSASRNDSTMDFNPLGCAGVEQNGVIHLLPTLSSADLSENDIRIFNDIVKTNNLQLITNRFGKFKNLPLFKDYDGVLGWDECAFTLNIAVVGESDFMDSADLVSEADYIGGLQTVDTRNKSNILTNSLCSWDLILHLTENANNFVKGDVFGEIDYVSSNDITQLPTMTNGYNYYYDFKDVPYMVPLVNHNAPNNFILNGNCIYNKEALNYPTYRPVQYNLYPLILIMPSFTLIGVLADIISVDSQLNQVTRNIVSVLNDISRRRQVEIFNNNLYIPKYEKYPQGSAEKALINISKDGYVWYKAEVPIFKYMNSLIAKRSKYRYIKLHRDSLRPLSIFNFSIVKTLQEIVEAGRYKNVYFPIELGTLNVLTADIIINLKKTKVEEKKTLEKAIEKSKKPSKENLEKLQKLIELISRYDQTLDSIGDRLRPGDTVELHNQTDPERNGLYGNALSNININVNQFTKVVPPTVNYTAQFLQTNAMYDIPINFDYIEKQISDNPEDGTIKELIINGNRTIIIPSIRPYVLFDKNEPVYTLKSSDELISEYVEKEETEKAEALQKSIEDAQQALNDAIANKRPQVTIDALENRLWNMQNYSFGNVIFNKGYLVKNGKYYTVFNMSNPLMGSRICKRPESCNTALIFREDRSTIDQGSVGFDIWSQLSDTNAYSEIVDKAPSQMHTLYGEGSYGQGTPLIRPNILSSQEIYNRPKNIKEFADYRTTDTKKSINITPYISGIKQLDISMSDVIGYSYGDEDIAYLIDAQEQIIISQLEGEELTNFQNKFKDIKTYTLNNGANSLIDIKSESIQQLSQNIGDIEIHNDISISLSTHKWTSEEVQVLQNRLKVLEQPNTLSKRVSDACSNSVNPNCVSAFLKSININSLYIDDLIFYIDTIEQDPALCNNLSPGSGIPGACRILLARDRLNSLQIEKNEIYYYLEKGGATKKTLPNNTTIYIPYVGPPIIPHIKYNILIQTDNSIKFEIENNEWGYWINIDPEQSCARDIMAGPKILLKVVQDCQPFSSVEGSRALTSIDLPHICNASPLSLYNTDVRGADVHFTQKGTEYQFITQPNRIKEELSKYPNAPWPEIQYNSTGSNLPISVINPEDAYCIFTFRRTYWMNMAGVTRNQLVLADETYLIPKNFPKIGPAPDGNVDNKIKNVFNLSGDERLFVKFKNTPRRIWGTDTGFETYKPNQLGQLTKTINRSGGPIYDNIMMWKCIDPKTGTYKEPPLYYKWMNEMIFRSFFGSVDGAEHRGNIAIEAKDPGRMVPFDFDRQ